MQDPTKPPLLIIAGCAGHEAAITALIEAVFTASEGPAEGQLVAGLAARLLALEPSEGVCPFMAWRDNTPVGALIFSPLRYPQATPRVMLLSPMAVATAEQGRGIGQALIAHALAALARQGTDIAVTYGDPAFYGRAGFVPVTTDDLPSPHPLSQPQGWIAQSLTGAPLPRIPGPALCAGPLDDPRIW